MGTLDSMRSKPLVLAERRLPAMVVTTADGPRIRCGLLQVVRFLCKVVQTIVDGEGLNDSMAARAGENGQQDLTGCCEQPREMPP